jgi:amino acid transporter
MSTEMWPVVVPLIGVIIAVLAVWRVWRNIQDRRSGFPTKDERTMRIQGQVASLAITVGSFFRILLLFYNMFIMELLGWQELGSLPALNSTLIVMNLTYLALQKYYDRKEHLE